VVFVSFASPRIDPEGRLHAYCHAHAGGWHMMGVMLSAGGSLRWYRDVLGSEESDEAVKRGVDPYEIITESAATAPPGCEGLIFLPYLTGERTPHADPYARGAFVGLTLRHGKPHLARAVLEGVTFGLLDCLNLVRHLGIDAKSVKGLLYAARIAVNPFGEVKYTESDLTCTEDFRMAVGLNAWLHQDDNHVSAEDDWSIGADLAIFYQSFFLTIELHYRENGVPVGSDVDLFGWSAQLGYFLMPSELEVSVRFVDINWDNNGTGTSAQREYLLGLGYFWEGHAMKLQTDFGWVENHRGNPMLNTEEWRFRLQFQLIF
jgi:hypothetical protein